MDLTGLGAEVKHLWPEYYRRHKTKIYQANFTSEHEYLRHGLNYEQRLLPVRDLSRAACSVSMKMARL